MTEPIANVSKFGLAVYYNFSEDSALGFLFAKNASGLSSYADQLRSQYSLDFSRAPQPLSTYMVDYNIKAFYGKMSLAKSIVLNTSMHGSLAGGITQYSHKSFPVIALGVGQKFYLNKAWALRFDMRLYAGQAPIPFLKDALHVPPATPDPVPSPSQFDERITFSTSLDAGLSYLF
jgi:outer membrane beta-barrel protein